MPEGFAERPRTLGPLELWRGIGSHAPGPGLAHQAQTRAPIGIKERCHGTLARTRRHNAFQFLTVQFDREPRPGWDRGQVQPKAGYI